MGLRGLKTHFFNPLNPSNPFLTPMGLEGIYSVYFRVRGVQGVIFGVILFPSGQFMTLLYISGIGQ